jgi:hypothetical protein
MGVLDVARRKTPMRLSYLGTVPSISLMLASPVLAQTDAGTAIIPIGMTALAALAAKGDDPVSAAQKFHRVDSRSSRSLHALLLSSSSTAAKSFRSEWLGDEERQWAENIKMVTAKQSRGLALLL